MVSLRQPLPMASVHSRRSVSSRTQKKLRCSLVLVLFLSTLHVCLVSSIAPLRSTLHPYIPPIPCRDDLAKVAASLYSTEKNESSVAVEIGVYRGDFAAKNLQHWQGKYVMVDAWRFRPTDPGDKNFANDGTNNENYEATVEATKEHRGRTEFIRNTSAEAVVLFDDHSIDWVYIDALHTHSAVLIDLVEWFPKVKCGGLISGDDYGDVQDNPLLPTERWLNYFNKKLSSEFIREQANAWGVVSAVNSFAKAHNQDLHVTWLHDCYAWPAWYFFKNCFRY